MCKEPEISVRITNALLSLMSALVVGVNALADISGWFRRRTVIATTLAASGYI